MLFRREHCFPYIIFPSSVSIIEPLFQTLAQHLLLSNVILSVLTRKLFLNLRVNIAFLTLVLILFLLLSEYSHKLIDCVYSFINLIASSFENCFEYVLLIYRIRFLI